MELYFVTLNIKSGSSTLSKLGLILNNYEGIRHEPDVWIIRTNEASSIIMEKINRYLSDRDTAFVCRISTNYACKCDDKTKRWINSRLMS